jgi:hypothetical protein
MNEFLCRWRNSSMHGHLYLTGKKKPLTCLPYMRVQTKFVVQAARFISDEVGGGDDVEALHLKFTFLSNVLLHLGLFR